LETICLKALQKRVESRYEAAGPFLAELQSWFEDTALFGLD
jgi:hypothetical protein